MAVTSSETSVNIYQTTRRNIAQDNHINDSTATFATWHGTWRSILLPSSGLKMEAVMFLRNFDIYLQAHTTFFILSFNNMKMFFSQTALYATHNFETYMEKSACKFR
jgi:hypothetical protein